MKISQASMIISFLIAVTACDGGGRNSTNSATVTPSVVIVTPPTPGQAVTFPKGSATILVAPKEAAALNWPPASSPAPTH